MSYAMDAQTQHLSSIIEKFISNGVNNLKVQDRYILPLHDRPQMAEVSYSEIIPVIDLKDLDGRNRTTVVHQIRRACEDDGFFQTIDSIHSLSLCWYFFWLISDSEPWRARECHEKHDGDSQRVLRSSMHLLRGRKSTSPVFYWIDYFSRDKVLHWIDYFTHPCHPLEEVIGSWPEKPAGYRDIAGKYAGETRGLILRLLAAISEALELDSDYFNRIIGKHSQRMSINCYPSCPNPDLTLGLPNHSDRSAVTLLMQGNVSGPQVIKNGKWVSVEPINNAFVVNLGDHLQVVSKGRFRSVEHRAVTNMQNARISISTLYFPSHDAFIARATSMVDELHPAPYRGYKFEEFMSAAWSKGSNRKSLLDHFKI